MEELTSSSRCKNSGSNIASKANNLLPCLVCGLDLGSEIDCVIKQEVDCDSDDDDLIEQCYHTTTTFTNLNDKSFERDHEESGGGGDLIFQWFLKWFKVDFEGNKKKGKLSRRDRESDGQGHAHDGDTLPFCETCRSQLAEMLELQLKLDELGRQIENGIKKVKEKIQSSEVDFKNNGIYERDPRYKGLRSKIIKSSGCERERLLSKSSSKSQSVPKEDQRNSDGGRKSSRTKMPISRFTSGHDHNSGHDSLPVVMVSPIDKEIAEEHLLKIEDEPENSPVAMEVSAPVRAPRKNMKKSGISNKSKNIKSKKARTKTIKKARRPPPKNVKSSTASNLKNTTPTTKIKEENDEDYLPDSPPAQDWDEDDLNNDSNDEDKEAPKSLSAPSPKKPKRKKNSKDILNKSMNTSNDPPKNCDEDTQKESNRKYQRFTEDPLTKSLSYGEFTFKLLDPQGAEEGEETQLQCITCSLVIPNKKSWVRAHVTKVHTNRFTCPHCPSRFSKITNMRYHIQGVHQGKRVQQKRHICEICGKSVTGPLKAHKWTHKNKEEKEEALATNSPDVPEHRFNKLQCDECGQSFNAKCNLQKHVERYHSGQARKLELCPECGGSYKELQAHMRYKHAKTEPWRTWECTEPGCGKKFKLVSHLTRHKNHFHLKIKPFKCTLCPRTFGTEGVLKRHMDSHLGIRPFKCDFCPSAFITRSAVNTHRRIFHEEGSAPRRKSYVRGPTMLQVGVTQEELRKKKMYYPPSLIRGAGAVAGSKLQGSSSQDNVGGGDHDEGNDNGQGDSDDRYL